MKIIGFIPARGGSKGIPNKNLVDLCGEPLIYYAIKHLLESNVDSVYVSSDSNKIKEVSEKLGAIGIHRPDHLAGDIVDIDTVLLNYCMEEENFFINKECDIVVMVQPTSPLINATQINKGIELVISGKFDSVFSAVKTNDTLIWDNTIKPMNYNPRIRKNRQIRKSYLYIETGGFYVFSLKSLIKTKCRIGGKIGVVEVPFWESFEIDCYEDLFYIERLMISKYNGEKGKI